MLNFDMQFCRMKKNTVLSFRGKFNNLANTFPPTFMVICVNFK